MNNIKHIVIYDLETSGLDHKRDAIIEIGARVYDTSFSDELARYDRKVLFKVENASPEALAKNGFDEALWKAEGVNPRVAAREFSQFLTQWSNPLVSARGNKWRGARMAGHNIAKFDTPFLRSWFERLGHKFAPIDPYCLDTYQMAMWVHTYGDESFDALSLKALCKYYDIELLQAHKASSDAEATAKLIRKLIESASKITMPFAQPA